MVLTALDDPPVAQNGSGTGAEDTTITGTVTATDTDTNLANLTYSGKRRPEFARAF